VTPVGGGRARLLAVRLALALALVSLCGACSALGRPGERRSEDGSEPTILAPATSRLDVSAGRLCEVAEAGDVVECEVLDLVPPERRECPERPPPPASPPCALPGNDAGRRLGWALTLGPAPARLRTLTVFAGAEVLSAMVRGSGAEPRWLMAAVCPSDVTGDGRLDVVALFRTTADPEHVVVEVVNVADAPSRVLTLPPQPFEPTEPQGCRSDLVARLGYDANARQLQLAPEEEVSGDRPLTA
jgi:hypothetical protein